MDPGRLDFAGGEYDLRAGTLHVELRRTARAAVALADALSEIAPPAGAWTPAVPSVVPF